MSHSRPRSRFPPVCESTAPIEVGSIVAIRSSTASSRTELAKVTGRTASGDTVDIQFLTAFVSELYVVSNEPSTYISISKVTPVPAEFVPSQNGWIVLDADLQNAKMYFDSTPLDLRARVEVEDEKLEPLSDEALQRQGFRAPTKTEALVGAAIGAGVAAAFWIAYLGAKGSYADNPTGDALLGGSVARSTVLYATTAGTFLSLIVAAALVVYALGKEDKEE